MKSVQKIIGFHAKLSKKAILGEAIALVIAVGYFDYITGYEVTIFPFYAIPIVLGLWFVGWWTGVFISILSAFAWWWADTASGHPYSSEWLQIWDTIVRLMFFCLIVAAWDGLRQQRDANHARIELLERSRKLEQEIVGISERERQTIGRDLHDDLGQYLVAIGFAADALKKDLEKEAPGPARAAGQIAAQLNNAVVHTRNLARGLSPVDQNDMGLELALDQLAFSASTLSGISCSFIYDGEGMIPDSTRDLHLYRIAQEALNNATKHAHAKVIVIALESEGDSISLRISDDGVGFAAVRKESNGMGLNIMHYRARTIGGVLEIQPNSPAGTVVSCTIDAVADNRSNPEEAL